MWLDPSVAPADTSKLSALTGALPCCRVAQKTGPGIDHTALPRQRTPINAKPTDLSGANMPFTPDVLDELQVLTLFSLDTTQEGIKVHSSADPDVIGATERLYRKNLITRADGGYLTQLGIQSAEHVQALLTILDA
jgi:uncharacterized protein (TIGR02647 family)